jgi:hypothetical protein
MAGRAEIFPEPSRATDSDAPAPGTFELELLSDGFVQLGFAARATLRVQLVDRDGAPVEGGHVAFALVGRSQDSSLATVDVVTNAEGIAENELLSGVMSAAFKVRITAPGAFETFIEVGVSNSGFGTLEVRANYTGARTVMRRLVVAQADMDCARAERMPGDPMVTLAPGETMAQFVALPAQVEYAILALAEGKDGTVVARGCTDAVVVRRDDRITARISFVDEPLSASGSFVLQADLDASAPAMALGSALRDGGEEVVNTDSEGEIVTARAEARFLLDSLDRTLRNAPYAQQPGTLALADAIAQERLAPSGLLSPEQSLQALLAIKDEGALVAVPRLAQLTIADLERLRLFVNLDVTGDEGDDLPISWRTQRIEALSADSAQALVAIDLASSAPVQTVATLVAGQDALQLVGVRFELPFGGLAAQVLHETSSLDAAREEIRALVGETALSTWLAGQSYTEGGACDAGCVQAACEDALTRLVTAAESALIALDATRPTLWLSGELALSDDDGDLIAEHMTTEMLTGEWEPEVGRSAGDEVSGSATAMTPLPVPTE